MEKTGTLASHDSHRAAVGSFWNVILALSLIAFAVVLVSSAWIGDDAYISLRTIDNFVNGYGLTWNTAERVQAYTHPLWMFVLAAFYAVSREAYYTTLFLSAALTLATVLLLVFRIALTRPVAVLMVVSLTLSKSFIDFSTSGLENPLTHLILVVWFVVYLSGTASLKRLFLLSLVASCAALNRLDVALILLPPYVLALTDHAPVLKGQKIKGIAVIAAGFLPLILWELFATFYYGFPLPNTFYAKLNTGLPQADLVQSGVVYLLQSAYFDPLVPLLIGYALVMTVWDRSRFSLAVSFGIILYVIYILRIGGDFMAGRFLTAPYLCALVIIVRSELLFARPKLLWVWSTLLVVGLISPSAPIYGARSLQCESADSFTMDVSDERGCFYNDTGLLKQQKGSPTIPNHGWSRLGLIARSDASPISIMGGIGMFGYFAGPAEYVVDLNALANPLLARLPVPEGKIWRIGHFERLIPGGYLETLLSGQNKICDRSLAEYYDKFALITRGRLTDPERLKAIWQINSGQLDGLLHDYEAVATTDQALLCNAQAVTNIPFAGGSNLRGYAVSSHEARPGDQLVVTLYWQGTPSIMNPLHSFVHIRNSQPNGPLNPRTGSEIWAQDEHFEPGGRLTIDYWPPQVYADQFVLTLPDDIPPGDYFVEVGWLDMETGEQLLPSKEALAPPLRELWHSVLLPSISVR
jgi:arabinofuranosyltransferase